jgi:hypothetical protein
MRQVWHEAGHATLIVVWVWKDEIRHHIELIRINLVLIPHK